MLIQLEPARLFVNPDARYATRLARDSNDVRAAQALRFAVFNLKRAAATARNSPGYFARKSCVSRNLSPSELRTDRRLR